MIRTWAWNGDASSRSAETPRRCRHPPSRTASRFSGWRIHRTARSLASAGADRVIKLWDAATLKEKQAFEAQPDWVMGLALSADGKWLAAGRYDGTLGLYGLTAGGPGNSSSCRT